MKAQLLMKKWITTGFVVIIICTGLLTGWNYFLVNRTDQKIKQMAGNVSAVKSLKYEKLKVGLLGDRLSLNNVTLKLTGIQETIGIRKILIPHFRTENDHLVSLKVDIEGAGVITEDLRYHDFLRRYGINETEGIISTITWFYQYDPHQKILTVNDLNIKAPGLAELSADIRLTNIDPSVVSPNSISALFPYLIGISISQTSISYYDRSLLQTSLSDQNQSLPSALASHMETMAANVRKTAQKEKDRQTRIILEKILGFINNPQEIHITLSPSKPVPVGRFLLVRNFGEVIRLLNVHVEM